MVLHRGGSLMLAFAAVGVVGSASMVRGDIVFSDNFNGDVSGWTSTVRIWSNQSWSALEHRNSVAGDLAAGTSGDPYSGGLVEYSYGLGRNLNQSWELTFDWGWDWGYGSNVGTGVALRSATGDQQGYTGYAFMIYQGDNGTGGRFQIRKYTGTDAYGWISTTIAFGSDGTQDVGSTNDATMDYKHARLTWDADTGELSAYYRINNSDQWIQVAQVIDSQAVSFDTIVLLSDSTGGVVARIDNVSVSSVPEPATAGVLCCCGMILLSRQKRCGVSK